MAKRLPNLTLCEEITGSYPAGKLLYRLAWWHSKTQLVEDGRHWVVRSLEQWRKEIALAPRAYQRALAVLVRAGLAVTRQRYHNGANRSQIALTQQGFAALFGEGDTTTLMTQSPGGHYDKNDVVSGGDTLYTCLDVSKNTIVSGVASHASSGEGVLKKDFGKTEKLVPKPKITVAEVLAGATMKPKGKPGLFEIWRDAVILSYPGTFVPNPTVTQHGQLKHFAAKCPPNAAEDVLQCVVRDWLEFAHTVAAEDKSAGKPAKPVIGYVLKHIGPAVNFWKTRTEQVPPEDIITEPVAVQTTAKPYKHDPYADKASWAEVQAILGGSDEA